MVLDSCAAIVHNVSESKYYDNLLTGGGRRRTYGKRKTLQGYDYYWRRSGWTDRSTLWRAHESERTGPRPDWWADRL